VSGPTCLWACPEFGGGGGGGLVGCHGVDECCKDEWITVQVV
jgi:hypothetical protein